MSNPKKFAHTFHYGTVAEFVTQLEEMRDKLLTSVELEPYDVVRAKYPHLSTTAFCMRVKRFRENFPRTGRYKEDRRGITHLFVTLDLHNYLSRPSR